jgi:L-rhamnose mutarotase
MHKHVCGQIGKLKKEKIEEYVTLHSNAWPEVLETIHRCNLRNYSIFLQGDTVFSYFEYVGEDYEKDMISMEKDEVTQEWWKHTKPCFERFSISPDSEFFHNMKQIFHFE